MAEKRHELSQRTLGTILVAAVLLSCFCMIAGVFNYVLASGTFLMGNGTPAAGGSARTPLEDVQGRSASTVAFDFMLALNGHSPLHAYHNLGDILLLMMSADDFAQQTAQADACAGSVTAFHLVKIQVGKSTAHVTYWVLRRRKSTGHAFSLTLLHDGQGKWVITEYGQGEHLIPPGGVTCR